jgi:hypothetical protein
MPTIHQHMATEQAARDELYDVIAERLLLRLGTLKPGQFLTYHVGHLHNSWELPSFQKKINAGVKDLLKEQPRRVLSVQRRIQKGERVRTVDGSDWLSFGFVYILRGIEPVFDRQKPDADE